MGKCFVWLILAFFIVSCGKQKIDELPSSATLNHEVIDGANNPARLFDPPIQLEKNWRRLPKAASIPLWVVREDWSFSDNGIAKKNDSQQKSPVEKYDLAFNNDLIATQWEKTHHGTQGEKSPVHWAGHCNGVAAAVVSQKRPKKPVTVNGVTFLPDDIVALMAEIYHSSPASSAGIRCRDEGTTSRDEFGRAQLRECRDLNPASFHLVLTNFMNTLELAPIIDIDQENEVWNAPITSYKIDNQFIVSGSRAMALITGRGYHAGPWYQLNPEAVKWVHVKMTIVFIYKYPRNRHYEYILELDRAGNIIGGEWVGRSRRNHPDFIWYPLRPQSANPWIDEQQVLKLVQESTSN
ncbi:MAG: hypothetical protein ISR65_19360 [Bacteriovoracaceae bacterium]|nr:hypothetical protein [Bacteriovoracaceae bacterium]